MDNTQVFMLGLLFGLALTAFMFLLFRDIILRYTITMLLDLRLGKSAQTKKELQQLESLQDLISECREELDNYLDIVNDYLNIIMKGKELMTYMLQNPTRFGIDTKSKSHIEDLLSGIEDLVSNLIDRKIIIEEGKNNE